MSFLSLNILPIGLGVNVDHIATLRNVRSATYPDLINAVHIVEEAGADVITVHLREDRRHINDNDAIAIRKNISTRMNLECALTSEMLKIACQIKPHDVCLVPEKRKELTTESGLEVFGQRSQVAEACKKLREAGVRVSLFIEPETVQIDSAAEVGASVVEIHTGRYANSKDDSTRLFELNRISKAVSRAQELGLHVNAGHGLNYSNVYEIAAISGIQEMNVGHSIIAHALFVGLANAVSEMKSIIKGVRFGASRIQKDNK